MKQEEFRLPGNVGTGYRFSTDDGTAMFYVVEPEAGVKAKEVFIPDVAVPAVRGLLQLLDGHKFRATELLSRQAAQVLIDHQRMENGQCLCGSWDFEAAYTHALHVLDQLVTTLKKVRASS